ncbi:MAG: hypothetical protein K0S76_413 [Herbinix sp.]|nr:hypothetical protein [Herbinix sp.]
MTDESLVNSNVRDYLFLISQHNDKITKHTTKQFRLHYYIMDTIMKPQVGVVNRKDALRGVDFIVNTIHVIYMNYIVKVVAKLIFCMRNSNNYIVSQTP